MGRIRVGPIYAKATLGHDAMEHCQALLAQLQLERVARTERKRLGEPMRPHGLGIEAQPTQATHQRYHGLTVASGSRQEHREKLGARHDIDECPAELETERDR